MTHLQQNEISLGSSEREVVVGVSALLRVLPCTAEEGSLSQSISIHEIDREIALVLDAATDKARLIRSMVQRLLCAACVLDKDQLEQGRWQFVSFPSALLARSLLSTLASPEQTLLPIHYWQQGAHRPDTVVEEQRALLHMLEEGRLLNAAPIAPPLPIRVVHVAWGIIKLDGRFLLLHREDRRRLGRGNYVLPGGRFQPPDWPTMRESDLPATQHVGTRLAPEILQRTLARELEEELSLRTPEHYVAANWLDIKPWRQIEGARNNHAYTEYLLSLFQVVLTERGEMVLHEVTASRDCLWFDLDEMTKQRQPGGATSYLDAIQADFGDQFAAILANLPESRPDSRPDGETEAIDFPHSERPLMRGKTGKEKPVPVELNERERSLLLGLAWHAKGLPFENISRLSRFPRGWVALDNVLLDMASALALKLKAADCILLEIVDGRYARINLSPTCIFLDPALFRFSLVREVGKNSAQHCRLTLHVDELTTPFGRTKCLEMAVPVTRNTYRIVQAVAAGKDPETEPRIKSGDIQKTLRDQIDLPFRACGLRKLIRIEDGMYRLNVQPTGISGSSPLAEWE